MVDTYIPNVVFKCVKALDGKHDQPPRACIVNLACPS